MNKEGEQGAGAGDTHVGLVLVEKSVSATGHTGAIGGRDGRADIGVVRSTVVGLVLAHTSATTVAPPRAAVAVARAISIDVLKIVHVSATLAG